VAVAGGGVIGLSVAWRAAQRGLHVVVLERDEVGAGTSRVAAGMLAPVSEATLIEHDVMRLGLLSAELYPRFVADLHKSSGIEPGYLECGTVLVARDRDEAEALERELDLRRRLGLCVRRLRPSQARELVPALTPSVRMALLIEGDHAIDPRRLTVALAAAARSAGALVRTHAAVAALETTPEGEVAGLRLQSGEIVSARQVVIAAGVWAGAVTGIPEALRIPLRPVKGQIMRLHDPAGPGLLTRVLRMIGGYLVPRGDGRYVLGATMEERGFDTSVTAGAVYELLRDAAELVPGISELAIDEISGGLRPAARDNGPVIGPSSLSGLHWAVGHYRHGILLAPITAELLACVLAGGELADYARAFAPQRFTHPPVTVEV
jgi:glycine oxidase